MSQKWIVACTFFSLLGLSSCKHHPTIETRDDFKKYYDRYNVEGSFALLDDRNQKLTLCNQSQFTKAYIPASTFKICNSLIGLETGVIPDENFVITWDSVARRLPAWNQDQDLKTAFKNSTVWYYQELARRVGGERMKYWLDKALYGNRDTSGGIDMFWLNGGLRITPEQQIDFLKRLHDNKLPFSQRSMDLVKKIMIVRDSAGYVLRAKTGWADLPTGYVGWYVGYSETKGNVYYFANCVQCSDTNNADFAPSRKAITLTILDELKLSGS